MCTIIMVHKGMFITTYEDDILKTKELMWIQICTNSVWDKGVKLSIWVQDVKDKCHMVPAKVRHRNPLWQDISAAVQQMLTKPDKHISW